MSSARVLVSCIVLLVAGACEPAEPTPKPEPATLELGEPEPPRPEPTDAAPVPAPEPVEFDPARLDELADHPGLAIGPAAAASDEQRIAGALSLLTDGSTAAQLPTIAADAGKRFDPRLADKLAPEPERVDTVVPRIVMKTPTVGPGLDTAIVRRIVRLHIHQIQACYDEGLAGNPALAGKAVIAWTIESDGKASNARVVESTVGDVVATCASKAVGRLKFPVPQGGGSIHVKYPFEFDPD